MLLLDSGMAGRTLEKNVKNIVVYDYCALSPHSAYLGPYPLAIRIPFPGPHLESDPSSLLHSTLRTTLWDVNP